MIIDDIILNLKNLIIKRNKLNIIKEINNFTKHKFNSNFGVNSHILFRTLIEIKDQKTNFL